MSPPPVIWHQADGVGLATLNRPERLNAFDHPTIELLVEVLDAAAADPAVRAVVLTGAGRGFCAGGDLRSMAARASTPTTGAVGNVQVEAMLRLTRATELLHDMPKPTIAAVNGPCAGAGLSLACAADIRYASESAVFTTAFLAAGQSGDYGGTWTLPRLIGAGRAAEMYLTGRRFGAGEAERFGLVTSVHRDDELIGHALGVAGQLAGAAPLAVAAIKANLRDAAGHDLATHLRVEAERFLATTRTRDAREAVEAFLAKRSPAFEGR